MRTIRRQRPTSEELTVSAAQANGGRRRGRSASTCPTRNRRRAGRSRCRRPRSRRRPARAVGRGPRAPPSCRELAAGSPSMAAQRSALSLCGGHVRHQGRRTAPHPRYPGGGRPAHAHWSISRPAANLRAPTCRRCEVALQSPARRRRPCSRATAAPRSPPWREAFETWISASAATSRGIISAGGSGGTAHGGARPCARCRSACPRCMVSTVASGNVRRLCRPLRHLHDVLGHRRAGAQPHLATGARQRRAGHDGHGQAAARRSARRGPAPRGGD